MSTATGTMPDMPDATTKRLRAISYGGGVQSTAMVVLWAQGIIEADVALFSNVGDDSEHPATLEFVRNIAVPWATERGLTIHELHRERRDGTPETLMGRLTKEGSKSLPIPVRMSNGAPGQRSCTADFKIRVVGKWLKEHGASEDNPADVLIGISTDELQRASNKKAEPYERPQYPLLDLGIDRSQCQEIIRQAGLPVPPKSSCFFCPFHKTETWQHMARDEPVLFRKSVELERLLNERRASLPCGGGGDYPRELYASGGVSCSRHGDDCEGCDELCEELGYWTEHPPILHLDRWAGREGTCKRCKQTIELDGERRLAPHGKDPVWLTRFARPLDEVVNGDQQAFSFDVDGPESCDEGYCWT